MKERPDDPEVHWRAVPSLREIWSEERKRMAHLLPPKENFLSAANENITPSFTLSVKKGADKPGSRLALEGNNKLFDSSPGLLEDFRRAMADIVEKHSEPLTDIDEKIEAATLRIRKKAERLRSLSKPSYQSSQDEALVALDTLLSQFSNDAAGNSCSQLSMSQNPINPLVLSQHLSQGATKLSQADLREVEDDLEYCENLEREDTHESIIDPSSLTPYLDEGGDVFDEEENMEEEEFEQCLTLLATQENSLTRPLLQPIADLGSGSSVSSKTQNEDFIDLTPRDSCSNQDDHETRLTQSSHDLKLSSEHSFCADEVVENSTPSVHKKERIHLTSDSSVEGSGDFWSLNWLPPLRNECQRSERLGKKEKVWHPVSRQLNVVVPWLGFGGLSRELNVNESLISVHTDDETYLEPTTKPPSKSRVVRWLKQKGKRENSLNLKMKQPTQLPKRQVQRQEGSQQTSSILSGDSEGADALGGIGQQGGKLFVEGGGTLKASYSGNKSSNSYPDSQVTIMSIEVHVQCRVGRAGVNNSREIAMKPDPSRDSVFAICYVYGYDPGGGETIEIIERACVYVPTEIEISSYHREHQEDQSKNRIISLVGKTMGCSNQLKIEVVASERQLFLRFASIVRWKDPDILMSWDTQGLGIGYLIDRGLSIGNEDSESSCIDMVRLLGRTPKHDESKTEKSSYDRLFDENENDKQTSKKAWAGSGLGAEWDDRVGAGAGPSSIIGRLVLNCRKIMSDEVKHPNNSYQQAMVAAVLKRRIPFHDDLVLTKWYGGNKGVERWRVLKYRICQALANVKLFDALDVIGRAGEAARLSGVELSQSFPGIRGSQYKVEGVLLRALQSLCSDERGEKRGKRETGNSLSANSEVTASQTQSPWKVRRNSIIPDTNEKPKGIDQRGYFFYSPSKKDAAAQEALECQAMTLEPQSGFHFDPVVVCDFTALYPSLIIAYNLCYSTCAGKLEYHSTRKEMRQKGKITLFKTIIFCYDIF